MTLEDRARAAMRGRGGDRCEICGSSDTVEASHRISRARGGTWAPPNIVGACGRCHRWFHEHPTDAERGGWHLATDADPAGLPVYLRSALLWPGWFTLDDRGDATPVDRDDVPTLPGWIST